MKLQIGERLTSAVVAAGESDGAARVKRRNAAVYVVREVLVETPWYGLYRGHKVLRNARPSGMDLEEADEAEWLNVLLKTVNYTRLDSREYVKARRDQVWFEAKKVLGCGDTNLLPEPIDYLEVTNAHDTFAFARTGSVNHKEPVLVFENISGQPLAKWYISEKPSVARVLRVLAEILEFLKVIHEEGFVGNSITPAAFWIDATDRVYHLATDCMVAARDNLRISADRFPQGFAPPEAFDAKGMLGTESDLYSWATLAYFLIVGDSPAQIAAAQGHRYSSFSANHKAKLADRLSRLSASEVAEIEERLAVKGRRFARHFPNSFVHAWAACVSNSADARPHSVDQLRAWFSKAPPAQVRNALAIRGAGNHVELLIETAGIDSWIEFVIRRHPGKSPRTPQEGSEVYSGQRSDKVIDTEGAWPYNSAATQYAVFCRDREDHEISYSQPTEVKCIDLRAPGSLLDCVHSLVQPSNADLFSDRDLPELLKLLSRYSSQANIVQVLFSSPEPRVRRWAISLIVEAQSEPVRSEGQQLILLAWEKGLRDPVFEIQLAAAAAIFQGSTDPGIGLLDRVAKALGGDHLDDRIRAMRALSRCGLSAKVIQLGIQALEADRIIPCKACGGQFKAGAMDDHLRSAHDFVDFESQLLPRVQAVTRLWPRLLSQYDASAAAGLAKLLVTKDHSVDALQAALLQQSRSQWLPANKQIVSHEQVDRLARCLRSDQYVLRASWSLVSADEQQLRLLGRTALLPSVAARLTDDSGTVSTFRQFVDALTRRDDLSCKIHTCSSLAQAGASGLVASRTAADFALDRENACPDCGTLIKDRDSARHQRVAHGRYVFEGRPWEWEPLVRRLGLLLLSGTPTLETATLCEDILEERVGPARAVTEYAAALIRGTESLPPSSARFDFIDLAASVIAQLKRADEIACQLLRCQSIPSQDLALAILATGIVTPHTALVDTLVPVLQGDATQENFREGAIRAILARLAPDLGETVLRAFIKPFGDKLVGIDRLRQLQSVLGNLAVINNVCLDLEARMKVKCPRCNAVMTGAEMRSHAQTVHRAVWEGRRLREPWSVAEDCLEQFSQHGRVEWLDAGEQFALMSGGEEHLRRYMRSALQRGLAANRYIPRLQAHAAESKSSLCCQCFASISSPHTMHIMPVRVEGESLVSDVVDVKNVRTLLQTDPEIKLHDGNWTGRQPPGHFSQQGVFILLAATFGAALVGIGVLAFLTPSVLGYVFGAWVLVGGTATAAAAFYRPRHSSPIAVAWEYVVPKLLQEAPDAQILAFMAGLVRVSEPIVDHKRLRHVDAAVRAFQHWYSNQVINYASLAHLVRLLLVDQLRSQSAGYQATHTMLTYLAEWAEGHLPLKALDLMTIEGQLFQRLPADQQRLLRWRWILLCDKTGLSPNHIHSLATSSSLCRAILTNPEPISLSTTAMALAVRHWHSNARSDSGIGTVFQWAEQGAPQNFRNPTDVLAVLVGHELVIRGDGVYFQQLRLRQTPSISVHTREQFVRTGWTYQRNDGGPDLRYKHNPPVGYNRVTGYELRVDGHVFPFSSDPHNWSDSIRRWAEVYFGEIEPISRRLMGLPIVVRNEDSGFPVRCPACGRHQKYVEGKVAVAS